MTSVTDSVSVSEVTVAYIYLPPSASDAVSMGETVGVFAYFPAAVSDAVSSSDAPSLLVSSPQISVSDSAAVSDAVLAEIAIEINGIAIPSSMVSRGDYIFSQQRIGSVTGNAQAKASGPQSITWTFKWMTKDEYDWWADTILSGAESAEVTATLRDHRKQLFSATSAVLYRPVGAAFSGNIHHNVTVEFDHIVPLRS